MRIKAAVCVAGCLCIAACGKRKAEGHNPAVDAAALLDLSSSAIERVRDGIGQAREGRFLNGGQSVLILDEFPPYLRLFTWQGDSLWFGGRKGDGPYEFKNPLAIATLDSGVFVVQPGRLSRWRLAADTLAFAQSWRLPAEYFPFGLEIGCNGELLLYARNDRQFKLPRAAKAPPPLVEYLHVAAPAGDSLRITSVWSAPRDEGAVATLGHNGVLLSRAGHRIVLLHRGDYWKAGRIIEFNCTFGARRQISESTLITGDSVSVQLPRERALQWTAGIGVSPARVLIPVQRFNRDGTWKTEVFFAVDGKLQGSQVLERQWTVMDYELGHGLLIATYDPIPHFIVVPDTLLKPDG